MTGYFTVIIRSSDYPIMFAWSLLLIAILITAGLLVTAVHHLALRTPYVRTSPRLARAMISLAQVRPGDEVWDLGAGDGSVLLEAKKQIPAIIAVGVEVVPAIWFLGWLRTRAHGITFLLKDARRVDLSTATVVLLYMTPHMLGELMPALRRVPKGTRIVTRAFRLLGQSATEEKNVDGATLYLYVF